jgi:ABC-type lipoprotein export system ATPase subunit
MISLLDLEFHYRGGEFSLRIPALDIEAGSTVALIGPSGTGKTTLLNLMAGYYLPHRGAVRIGDLEVSNLPDGGRRDFRIRHIGLVFQEFELLEYLNLRDNVLLPYRISSALTLDASVHERAQQLAREVGLGDKLRRNVSRLSQGERQRVAVCRALLPEPDILLCDEPTGNLDPANKEHVLQILFDYVTRNGTTLVVVTHDHELLPRFQRVIDVRALDSQATRTDDHGEQEGNT